MWQWVRNIPRRLYVTFGGSGSRRLATAVGLIGLGEFLLLISFSTNLRYVLGRSNGITVGVVLISSGLLLLGWWCLERGTGRRGIRLIHSLLLLVSFASLSAACLMILVRFGAG